MLKPMRARFNSSTSRVVAQLEGFANAMAYLRSVGPNKLKAALKKAGQSASKYVVKRVQELAPQRVVHTQHDGKRVPVYGSSGTLKKSIGFRVGVNRRNGHVYAVIGPRRRFTAMAFIKYLRRRKSDPPRRNVMTMVRPSLYTHLVENGFTAQIWGQDRFVHVKPRPFLRPALRDAEDIIEGVTRKAILEELER